MFPEAEILLRRHIVDIEDTLDGARALIARGAAGLLLKGGHLRGDGPVVDVLALPGDRVEHFEHPRLQVRAHGTGCTLASAIAANLALGHSLVDRLRTRHGLRASRAEERLSAGTERHHRPRSFRRRAMNDTARWLPCSSEDGHGLEGARRVGRAHRSRAGLDPRARRSGTHVRSVRERARATRRRRRRARVRGFGSSSWRASRHCDWAYRELLCWTSRRRASSRPRHSAAWT